MTKDYSKRVGPYIRTASGGRFYFQDLNPDDVTLEDIAHHLSHCNRFAGATPHPYSVAQHSVLVAALVRDTGANEMTQRAALLHDAAEAYTGDLTSPFKSLLNQVSHGLVSQMEHEIDAMIRRKFFIDEWDVDFDAIHAADRQALLIEQARFFPHDSPPYDNPPNIEWALLSIPPWTAEAGFMFAARALGHR